MLKTENLCKSMNGKAVITDLNLEIPEETVFGLTGKNGAGKSTLLRMLAGIYRPDKGSVSLDGNDPFTSVKARSELVIVPDELNRIPCSSLEGMRKMYEAFYPFDSSRYHACLQAYGRIIIYVNHNKTEVQSVADTVYRIRNGELLLCGTR